jgi:hypothetical protein
VCAVASLVQLDRWCHSLLNAEKFGPKCKSRGSR